jgi:Outer membrane receptor for ferrienterochelin and colicins
MSMLRKLLFTLGLFLTTSLMLYSQGTLTGTITDAKTGEPLSFVNVVVQQGGQQQGGAQTDEHGNYQIKPLEPGNYDVIASFVGYKKSMKRGVRVNATGFSPGGSIALEPTSKTITDVVITDYAKPLIQTGTAESGQRVTNDEIDKMPANTVDAIIATVGGITDNDGSAGSARGETGMVTYVNGVAKKGSVNIPKQAIGEIQVILGGTPARYGEAIGGTTNITLRPPQNTFNAFVKYETSEPFNDNEYHRVDVYMTGPLYKRIDKATGVEKSIIGYRLSGFNSYVGDQAGTRPTDRRYFMLKQDKQDYYNLYPLRYDAASGAIYDAGSFLKSNDFERVSRKSNMWSEGVYLEGGLDIRFTDNTVLQINGEYTFSIDRDPSAASILLNNDNNSESRGNSFQIMGDFTQKFSNASETSTIKNLIFNLTGSYSRSYSETYNPNYKDDMFKYGHVGTFKTYKRNTYSLQRMEINGVMQDVYVQNGWQDYQVDFTPSEYNPYLARYTWQLYNDANFASIRSALINYNNIEACQGLTNGDRPNAIYSMFSNFNSVYSSYSKSESQGIYLAAKVSADIGKHSLEFGFQYDQSIYSSYSLNSYYLWKIMKNEVNTHIANLDLDNPIIDYSGSIPYVSYNRKYVAADQTYFDKAIRSKLGLDVNGTDWIDIDNYDPSTFSMDMFSADELFNSGNSIVSYYGYDYTGKKVSGKQSLQDFFTNSQKRNLGAWEPIYMAGYVQDQFYFKDLIFNIGVRVDRFDGNQMGLKDPYLLYNAYTAGEIKNYLPKGVSLPSSIGDDYVVYVNSLNGNTSLSDITTNYSSFVKGFRSGNTWYNANGEIVSDPNDVAGASGQPLPFRKGTLNATGVPTSISTDAFEDYKPQVVAMPRIAFSFPVSDKSEFKASYDMIARRPSVGWQADYVSYLYMEKQSGATLNNPNLKPEKITNYELGFTQVLSKSSVLTISAYYKETRDLIALVQYVGADPTTLYYSYGNQDFRTTKGMTINYELRRSSNIRINANYTLQYAEGTSGLPATTRVSLIQAGYPNIKMLYPISDDRRHEFKLQIDFRYDGGNKYNGPTTKRIVTDKNGEKRTKEIKWLQNFGVNLTGVAGSGHPYTKYLSNTTQTIVGNYNAARLPWTFRIDMNIDKTFMINVGKRVTQLNFFARITNVLNIKNITGVYGVTGDANDNGYLTDPETQTVIANTLNEASYRNYYSMYYDNANYFYSSPRMVILGVSYTF